MEFRNTEVFNIEGALRSMRNPKNSWHKSDSEYEYDQHKDDWLYVIGENDLDLAQRLVRAGTEHSKFMRSIFVSVDIVCPTYIAAELDTYKVGTTRNSCSLQHKGSSRDFEISDFTVDNPYDQIWNTVISYVNTLRKKYLETKDYTYFRQMRQLMPMGYNYTFTWTANYAVLRNIYKQRCNHSLKEWHEFCEWIETLPYAKELITI
jgi:hypothetical protein